MMELSPMAKKTSAKAGAKKPPDLHDTADLYRRIKGKTPEDWTSATFFMPRATHRTLRMEALTRDTTLQGILAKAVDDWLRKEGLPGFFPPDMIEQAT